MFLVRKVSGHDSGKLYAMKVLKKATIVQKAKTAEHTRTERQVLEHIRESPFLVTLHYAFQTDTKLHLILGTLSLLSPLWIVKNVNCTLCLLLHLRVQSVQQNLCYALLTSVVTVNYGYVPVSKGAFTPERLF